MSTEIIHNHHSVHAHEHGHDHHHDASANTVIGFWLYLMTDLILFATLFATYVVLAPNVADGPSGKDIFGLSFVLTETFALLFSSITYGMAMLAVYKKQQKQALNWLMLTFLLGLVFIGMEIYEFHELISENFGPERSGFLSAFFTLVATHGLHVTVGLVWMLIMMIQVVQKGITDKNSTRLMCLSLFWHFLDIVWICVFTIVYLMGAM